MRTAAAKAIAERVRLADLDADAAADAGMAELARVGGSGGFILIDRNGACAARFKTEQMLHAWVERGGEPQIVP